MTIWLAPGTQANINKSIDQNVPWSFIERYLNPVDVKKVKEGADNTGAYCWAMTEGSQSHFDSMMTGDEVLITPRGTGLFTRYAQVYHTAVNANFGIALWPNAGEKPWKNLFFLRNIHKIELSKHSILSQAGYNNPKDALSGIRPVKGQQLALMLQGARSLYQKLGLQAPLDVSVLKPTADPITLEERVRKIQQRGIINIPKGTNKPQLVISTGRKEIQRDPAVKAWVKMKAQGKCELCLNPAPFSDDAGFPYLEVHHVVTLGEGGPDTVSNSVALCPTCHRFLHFGNGRLTAKDKLYNTIGRLTKE